MQAIEVASDFVGESIPVLSRVSGKLKGVVTEADIFQAYMSTQVKINDLERRWLTLTKMPLWWFNSIKKHWLLRANN